MVINNEDFEGGQKFQVEGPPLARSARSAVYAVKALNTLGVTSAILPEGTSAILRHGHWIGDESVFVETHVAALERLRGRLGHPDVICKGVIDQPGDVSCKGVDDRPGGKLERERKQALAVVESYAGKSLQPGSLDGYGVCQLGAHLCSQFRLPEDVGILQRDLSLSNVLVRPRRLPLPADPLPRGSASAVDSAESPLQASQRSTHAVHFSSSEGASRDLLSTAAPPESPNPSRGPFREGSLSQPTIPPRPLPSKRPASMKALVSQTATST